MNAVIKSSVDDATAIRAFRIDIPDSDLAELRRRIESTIWPEQETVANGTQGVQLAFMQALARYWATDYDWRKVEARLNALPNFITTIDGLDGARVLEPAALPETRPGRSLRGVGAACAHRRRFARGVRIAA